MEDAFCPKLPEETVMLEEEGKYLFLLPSRPDWVVVNRNAAALLSLCDGKHSVCDLKAALGDHAFAGEALELLDTLEARGYFEEKAPVERRPGNLHSLHLNLTDKCNLNCIYCYAKERNDENKELTGIEKYKELIDEVYAINDNCTITFTGGEPLLYSNVYSLAEYCKAKGLPTFLLTNGTLITDENAGTICNLFDSIRFSLDGFEDLHDRQRGKGSYAKVMRAVELLKEHGGDPMLAMTVTSLNGGEIERMAAKFGSNLTFQPLYNIGNARERNLGISGAEYYAMLREANGVEPYGQIARTLENAKCNCGDTRCAIATGEISISHTGDVYPCHMLHLPEFLAGNIHEWSFREIYEQSPVLNRIRALSVHTRGKCKDCPIRLLCSGGCWARDFYEHGDLNQAGDFCDYEFLAFKTALLQA